MDALRTEELCKRYGAQEALHKLTLRVPSGSLYGFLGPNGAGKSTTIRLLLGLLRASGGRAEVLGRDAWREGPLLRAEVGYLPGEVRFYDQLTGRATLRFLDAARGGGAAGEMGRLAELFGLALDRRVRDYSRGMKQMLGLIQALMHRPRLLILDEPTVGLDPLVRRTLFAELRRVARQGRTVFFSSHTLSEVGELCDRVAILRAGRLIAQERIETLRARAVRQVEIVFGAGGPTAAAPDGLRVSQRRDRRISGTWSGPVDRLLGWLAQQPVRELTLAPPDLGQVFLRYYADGPGP